MEIISEQIKFPDIEYKFTIRDLGPDFFLYTLKNEWLDFSGKIVDVNDIKIAFLYHVSVEESKRFQGSGSNALKALEDKLKSMGVIYFISSFEKEGTNKFLRKCNFSSVSEEEVEKLKLLASLKKVGNINEMLWKKL